LSYEELTVVFLSSSLFKTGFFLDFYPYPVTEKKM